MSQKYYEDEAVTLYYGDCREVLRELADSSIDSVVTDPPYELAFMGKGWDATGIAYDTDLWRECLRVLKPGGHILAFGGSRTWHRLAVAVEDAGFEIRDSIAWLYGSGFPKSLDVSKAIDKAQGATREIVGVYKGASNIGKGSTNSYISDRPGKATDVQITVPASAEAEAWQGWGTALKPAFEPIVVGRKPLVGTVAVNVLSYGTGALNIDATRIPMSAADAAAINAKHSGMNAETYERRPGVSLNLSTNPMALKPAEAHEGGRWPSNVVLDESQAVEVDRQSGTTTSTQHTGPRSGNTSGTMGHDDTGGASRVFPVFRYESKAPTSERPVVNGIAHPTVKPLALMQWLVRLVTPRGGIVLEPFAGSGTTAEACVAEGLKCVAIEREESYLPLIVQRLTKPIEMTLDLGCVQ